MGPGRRRECSGVGTYPNGMMLSIEGLSVSYGGLTALRGVSLSVAEGQFVAIVGPNGAGKTTLFKAISGTVEPGAGKIGFEGRDLLAVPPAERAHLGIAHVPEGRQVFASMTVLENLEMGAYSTRGRPLWQRNLERIFSLFPVLAERRRQLAGTLSGGEQQMLAIGRAIASAPRLLLLDEPSMGLAPAIADLIFDRIAALHREDGVTLILVEQRVAEALESSDYGYVLETGQVVLEGSHRALMADDRVRRAYLGM
jgi:branched-chain amino acid transport system ATP-binding protein